MTFTGICSVQPRGGGARAARARMGRGGGGRMRWSIFTIAWMIAPIYASHSRCQCGRARRPSPPLSHIWGPPADAHSPHCRRRAAPRTLPPRAALRQRQRPGRPRQTRQSAAAGPREHAAHGARAPARGPRLSNPRARASSPVHGGAGEDVAGGGEKWTPPLPSTSPPRTARRVAAAAPAAAAAAAAAEAAMAAMSGSLPPPRGTGGTA